MNLQESLKEHQAIRLGLSAKTWQEAVKLAAQPLIDNGAVSISYYEAIMASTEKHGPYYILMPGVAMPHAAAGQGVFRDAFSLITLKQPVLFSDGKEVSILITLAATTATSHTKDAIPQLVALLELDNVVERLLACQTPADVLAMVEESQTGFY